MDLPADFQRINLTDNAQDELDHLSVLPTEVLEIIFSFVRPKSLYQNVLPACRRFRLILSADKWWLRRIRTHHFKVRLCDAELGNDDFSPIRCQLANKERCIESVKLFERYGEKYCITSARNRVDSENYTQCIQLWNLNVATEISKKDSNLANDSLSICERTLACYNGYKTILLLDVDHGLQEIGRTTELPTNGRHSYIKTVKLEGTTVYALFTDQLMTLDVRNLRAGPVHRHVFDDLQSAFLFDGRQIPHRHWYTSMSVADGVVHCSHNGGGISVLQAADLTPCYSFYASDDYCERLSLNYVAKTTGSVLSLTTDTVTAFSLGSQPVCIGKAYYRGNGEPMLDVLQEDVVVGSLNGLIYWPTDK